MMARYNVPVEVSLRIVVRDPVPGVWAAIQHGKGSAGRPHEQVREPIGDLAWTFAVTLTDGRLRSPFLQKDSKGTFVYVLWGTCAGQPASCVTRRAKVYLPAADTLATASAWEAEFAGRGRDGGPACASVSLSAPWRPRG